MPDLIIVCHSFNRKWSLTQTNEVGVKNDINQVR